MRFTDITKESGITFVHENGAYGERLLPETMGGGVAFFDFDGDGNQGLLFVNSCNWPWHVPEGKPQLVGAQIHDASDMLNNFINAITAPQPGT